MEGGTVNKVGNVSMTRRKMSLSAFILYTRI